MTVDKEEAFKKIEGRVDKAQEIMVEIFEIIYAAGYNEAIEEAIKQLDPYDVHLATRMRSLKK